MIFMMKIVIIGDDGVGKRSLGEKIGKGFIEDDFITTIGADTFVRDIRVKGRPIKYQFWILAGDPSFKAKRTVYYRGCFGALLVYDVTRPKTFKNCESWIQEFWGGSGRGPVPFVLLGNKTDLRDQYPNHITAEQGMNCAKKWTERGKNHGVSINYYDISVKSGYNVDPISYILGEKVFVWIDFQKARSKE